MENYEKAIEWVISREGGYVWDKLDPGGETNFGISKRAFPELDIKNLTRESAKDIYKRVYWTGNNLDSLDWPFSAACLDSYVQHRPSVVRKMIEEAQGDLRALLEARRVFYLRLISKQPQLARFKRGWLSRISDLSKFCDIEKNNAS